MTPKKKTAVATVSIISADGRLVYANKCKLIQSVEHVPEVGQSSRYFVGVHAIAGHMVKMELLLTVQPSETPKSTEVF